MNTLKEWCNSISPIKLSVTKNSAELQFKNDLFEETSFLSVYNTVPISLRYYCVLNDITKIPKCLCCDNPVTYKKDYPQNGFAFYCSPKCSRKDKTVDKTVEKLLKNKEWLYNQRISQKKSKELIAKELGISITPVYKWLQYHNIPDVKYNESHSDIRIFLEDYSWMYDQYKVQHKKQQQIADELGVAKSTVGLYLIKHNIIANDINSYDKISDNSSVECLEIVDFIKSFYTKEIILNKRGLIGGLELDIYLPDDNFAIEYNGIYSHYYRPEETTFSKQKGPKYHLTKTEECEKIGISLLHIISTQWQSNKDLWKSVIKYKLGFTDTIIYARKCEIREVSVHEKNMFLIENHIQGNASSIKRYGLYYGDELVSLITFGIPRYNKSYTWELIRFCNKRNCSVVGGFTKLLSFFRKNNPGSIITYANRMYSDGNLYEKSGFVLETVNKPSYWYIDKSLSVLIHKSRMRKSILLKQLNKPEYTENELSTELGYKIIWDCGTKTYILE